MAIITRFAPSPTGQLHIGGARVALFNFLFAKKNETGKFILRIDDTDITRSSEESLQDILENLKWLSISWDELFFQSKRINIYTDYAKELIKENKAYYAEGAIKFKINKEKKNVIFYDKLRGKIEFPTAELEDFVIIKKNNWPTYNFSTVVDDIEMKITHIIRGEDHLSNTPKQILLYEAFNCEPPIFCHLPLILSKDKKPLSKRDKEIEISIDYYKKAGYLPEALLNYLSLLSFSAPDGRQLIRREELFNIFSLDRLKKSPAIFDVAKLNWLNKEYISIYMNEPAKQKELIVLTNSILSKYNLDEDFLLKLLNLYKERIYKIKDIEEYGDFFFKEDIEITDEKAKLLATSIDKELLSALYKKISLINNFTAEKIEEEVRSLAATNNLKAASIIHPLRAIVTGKSISPPLFDVLSLLGKEKLLKRLEKFISCDDKKFDKGNNNLDKKGS